MTDETQPTTAQRTTVSRTFLISEEQAQWIEKLSRAMRLSEDQVVSLILTGWQRSGEFAAWLAEDNQHP